MRSILEFGVPVWNSALTKEHVADIERVQKSFLYIVLENEYLNYDNALANMALTHWRIEDFNSVPALLKRQLKIQSIKVGL